MTDKFMPHLDDSEDVDTLIDRAVDTFFVEAPEASERPAAPEPREKKTESPSKPPPAPKGPSPSLDDAVDTLFMSSFEDTRTSSVVTSGDPETDRAIDLAVDTLFVEEPETPIPDTAELPVRPEEPDWGEDFGVESGAPLNPESAVARLKTPPEREPAAPAAQAATEQEVDYNDAMAREIERHMQTMFQEPGSQAPRPSAGGHAEAEPSLPRPAAVIPAEVAHLRKLQEAILTLEWEISKRSVTALATELQRVRLKFRDNVTVDFAALSMKVVLDYLVKRMSRAHPESVRFLLEVADFLERTLISSKQDPLAAFHRILTRYETYKSTVRKAEGLVDRKPSISHELGIKNPDSFAEMVQAQTMTMSRAGQSLAVKLQSAKDPENLIRSFRFLVNRSVNRILESTRKDQNKGAGAKKTGRSA